MGGARGGECGAVEGVWRARADVGCDSRWALADRIVYSKIRAGVGGRLHARSISGRRAPFTGDSPGVFWAVGIPVYQGYGLTETSPVSDANTLAPTK